MNEANATFMLSAEAMDSNEDESPDDQENISTSHDSVKSTAVVKYSTVETPAAFAVLQCNTDLNLPPANWLSSSAESYGLQYVLSGSTGYSSFRMADLFPDCVGEVDVISDAENIKKLLKLPYSKGPVSMLVHRIKTTLLIDDFDFQKFFYKSAEVEWLSKNVVQECVFGSLENEEKCIPKETKSRNVLQQENLFSKFLHHSLGHLEQKEPEELKTEQIPHNTNSSSSKFPPLPEPNIGEELPSDSEHKFVRNVMWTFENIQMLLGTDMPIFGGGTHPCVSLRLRDMSKPISVLTGIDYWLDNLMCNVPEVAMCFHIDGFVKKYELVKTEDLPYMEDSKFSPVLIRDVAKHILAFLKSNATKAGHTYWLLKGRDDDVVKLYDLTSLCSSSMADNSPNPFTTPVALLLYRVARNMKHAPRVDSPSNPGTIRMLLKNCIRLLPKEKYPQIITSAHYMFSDSLIPLNTDPSSPKLEDVYEKFINSNHRMDIISGDQDKNEENDDYVKTLCLSEKPTLGHENFADVKFDQDEFKIMRDIEKRCKTALEHIADGLDCLKYFDTVDTSASKKKPREEEKLNMAHPCTPIPMPYDTIKKENIVEEKKNIIKEPSHNKKKKKNTKKRDEESQSIGALLCKSHIETLPTWQNPPDSNDNKAWQEHLRILLYEKACLVYATLAEREYSNESYGLALKHIRLVLECRAHLTNGTCENILMSFLLGRAGDCCFQIARKWHLIEKFRAEFSSSETFDEKMTVVIKEEDVTNYKEIEFLPTEITTLDNILNNSWMCYAKALSLEDRDVERDALQRRVGNICNELGTYYMRLAKEARVDENLSKEKIEALFAISLTHLENGIKAFKSVKDDGNLALLYSNSGHLMRVMAHFYTEDGAALNKVAKSFYTKAQSNYQLALAALGSRSLNPEIWDTVFYELSTTLYSMATLLQDYPPQNNLTSKSDLERELSEYLSKALKYCDMERSGPKQPIYQYRAADIEHRLGSLYHKTYRDLDKESSRRSKILQLCQLHYEKAVKLYLMLEVPPQFLRAQLERVALFEFMAENSNGPAGKIRSLQNALDLMLQTAPILKIINERSSSESIEGTKSESSTEISDCDESSKEKKKDHLCNGKVESDDETNEKDLDEISCENDETKDEAAEEQEMLNLLESRLQFILKSLIKQCSSSPKNASLVSKYKEMYSTLLQSSKDRSRTEQRLYEMMTRFYVESD